MKSPRSLRIALVSTCLSLASAATSLAQMPADELNVLRERAETGDPIAQHNLGLKYADSRDQYFNLVESYAWLKTAASRGASGNALAVVEGQLSPAQRTEGDARIAAIAQTIAAKGDAGPAPGVVDGPVGPMSDSSAEYRKLSEELSAAWKENDQLKSELGRLRAASANFEGERNALLQKVQVAEAAAARAATVSAAAPAGQAAEVKAVQAQLDEAQLKLEAALGSFSQQQRETDRVQKALVAVEQERASLAERLTQLEREAQNRPAAAPAADPSLAIQLQAAEGALRQVQAERDKLRSDLEAARSASSAVSSAPTPAAPVATETGTVPDDDTRKALADIQMKLDVSLRAFAVQREEVDRLQQRIASLEEEKSGLESRLQTTGTQLSDTNVRAEAGDRASAELAKLQEQLRQTQNQLASVVTENMQMRDRLSLAPRATSGALLVAPMRPSAAPTPTPAPVARTHQIVPGDTLSRIAKRYLGNAERWPELLDANPGLDPARLSIGETITLPAE
ncbi:MAG: LysM peptidoglycan-binding domain-containing protein [Opitutaceae bacterium]|nr:LysM peptidoglycan-binding domain-containing protein [Opitutaceae bacterium]